MNFIDWQTVSPKASKARVSGPEGTRVQMAALITGQGRHALPLQRLEGGQGQLAAAWQQQDVAQEQGCDLCTVLLVVLQERASQHLQGLRKRTRMRRRFAQHPLWHAEADRRCHTLLTCQQPNRGAGNIGPVITW